MGGGGVRGGPGRGLPLLAAVLLLLWGCADGERLRAQREALEEEHRERIEELDRIEARLHASAILTTLWKELGRRHETVSEIACENVALHAEEMVRYRSRQAARVRRSHELAQATLPRDEEAHAPSSN